MAGPSDHWLNFDYAQGYTQPDSYQLHRSGSSASLANSVHSDVSEYDPSGRVTRRTVTTTNTYAATDDDMPAATDRPAAASQQSPEEMCLEKQFGDMLKQKLQMLDEVTGFLNNAPQLGRHPARHFCQAEPSGLKYLV